MFKNPEFPEAEAKKEWFIREQSKRNFGFTNGARWGFDKALELLRQQAAPVEPQGLLPEPISEREIQFERENARLREERLRKEIGLQQEMFERIETWVKNGAQDVKQYFEYTKVLCECLDSISDEQCFPGKDFSLKDIRKAVGVERKPLSFPLEYGTEENCMYCAAYLEGGAEWEDRAITAERRVRELETTRDRKDILWRKYKNRAKAAQEWMQGCQKELTELRREVRETLREGNDGWSHESHLQALRNFSRIVDKVRD